MLATDAQKYRLRKDLRTRDIPEDQRITDEEVESVTKRVASGLIDRYTRFPVKDDTLAEKVERARVEYPDWSDVPTGYYILADGRIIRIKKSRTTGRKLILVMPEARPNGWGDMLRRADEQQKVYAELKDPDALRDAALKFGRTTEHCFRCGAELSDPLSKLALVGPTCVKSLSTTQEELARHNGVEQDSIDEAKALRRHKAAV